MNDALVLVAYLLTAAVSVGIVVSIVRNHVPDLLITGGLAALEIVLLAITVMAAVQLGSTDRDVDGVTLIGYLLTSLLISPLALFWALADKSRQATAVLLIACITIAVMLLRAQQVWSTGLVG